MNVFTRLGVWWDQPSTARKIELLDCQLAQTIMRIAVMEAEKQLPSTASKEINMLKVRLDRIELLVGLKREPVITNLPDAPRIS